MVKKVLDRHPSLLVRRTEVADGQGSAGAGRRCGSARRRRSTTISATPSASTSRRPRRPSGTSTTSRAWSRSASSFSSTSSRATSSARAATPSPMTPRRWRSRAELVDRRHRALLSAPSGLSCPCRSSTARTSPTRTIRRSLFAAEAVAAPPQAKDGLAHGPRLRHQAPRHHPEVRPLPPPQRHARPRVDAGGARVPEERAGVLDFLEARERQFRRPVAVSPRRLGAAPAAAPRARALLDAVDFHRLDPLAAAGDLAGRDRGCRRCPCWPGRSASAASARARRAGRRPPSAGHLLLDDVRLLAHALVAEERHHHLDRQHQQRRRDDDDARAVRRCTTSSKRSWMSAKIDSDGTNMKAVSCVSPGTK